MEFREADIIVNVDRRLDKSEEHFIKGASLMMLAVLEGKQAGLACYLLGVVVKALAKDLKDKGKI